MRNWISREWISIRKLWLLQKQNAEEAGVEDCIHFRRADAAKLHAQGQNGILITNTPYGERIGEEKEIQKIYGGLKNFLQNHPD